MSRIRDSEVPETGLQTGSPWMSTSTIGCVPKTMRGGSLSTGTRRAFRSAPSMPSAASIRASGIVAGALESSVWIVRWYVAAIDGTEGKVALVMEMFSKCTVCAVRSTMVTAEISTTPNTGSFEPAGRTETAACAR